MKTKQILFYAAFLLLVFALFTSSCKKKDNDNDDNNDPTPQNNAGLGDNPGFPSGTAYSLPSHLLLLEQIRGGIDYGKTLNIPNKKEILQFLPNKEINAFWEYYGSGTYVEICMKLYNTLNTDTTVIIPGGLIFVDSAFSYQNGIVLQSVTIPVPATDTAFAVVRAYCCNLSRHVSDSDAIYHFGPVTNNSELEKIINILKNKQMISMQDYNIISEIQTIIWNVTDFNQSLTQEELNYLNSLP